LRLAQAKPVPDSEQLRRKPFWFAILGGSHGLFPFLDKRDLFSECVTECGENLDKQVDLCHSSPSRSRRTDEEFKFDLFFAVSNE
jgi:hypothetical protein